jgi:hypothetical protein
MSTPTIGTAARPAPSRESAPAPDAAPIFVVGSGRSGTTLLRLMLNAHPRIYLTHEASFWLVQHHLATRSSAEEWLATYFDSFNFAWLDLDPALVRAELPRNPTRTDLPDAYRAVMRVKARSYGKPRYGDKTPWHAVKLAELFRDFPDARVIHIVRDPRAAIASLMKMPWGSSSYTVATWFCKKQVEGVEPFRERICEVRLEDLLAEPRATMEQVLAFVGEPWDERVLDHARHAPTDDVPPLPWYLPATEQRGSVQRARREPLPDAWTRIVERRQRTILERYGYAPAELAHEPRFPARLAAFLRDVPEALRFLRRFLPGIRRWERHPPSAADAQRFFFDLNPRAWEQWPGFAIPDPPRQGERREATPVPPLPLRAR